MRALHISLALLLCSIFSVTAQENGLKTIEDNLDKMDLAFLMPTENAFKFSKLKKSDFFDYDSKIRARSRELEVLIALHPDGENEFTSFFPHLEFNRLLANLTPNDDEQEVLVVGWRETKLRERNADWGAEAYFTPRKEVTDFPYTKLIAFFKEGQGMVVMLYCFHKPDALPLLLSFDKGEKN